METVRTLSRRIDGIEYAVDRLIERLDVFAEESEERSREAEERSQRAEEWSQRAEERSQRAEERSRKADRSLEEMKQLWRETMKRSIALEKEEKERSRKADEQFADFQRQMDEANREHRREQGRLSNKMGTLVEDLVAPSIPAILQQMVNSEEPPSMFSVRTVRRDGGRTQEYDVVALCGDYLLINETKSNLRSEDIPKFKNVLREARIFFPEYADKKIIGALATFYVDHSLVVKGEREGLIMLGAAEGIIELLNQDQFVPRLY